jgi:UDP-N-acetylglucosamine 2-epimerase (non-hydrolysing)
MTPMMSAPRRILTVFGTRPEAIKLFPLIHSLQDDPRFASRICVSGQHRGMLDQVLAMSEVIPDHDLNLMRSGQSLDDLTASLVVGLGRVMDEEKPDCVVVQGDTSTAMCGALAAYYRQIPVAHVEAGLRSGDIHHPWPEEVNRKIIAGIAAQHFAPTENAAASLRREAVDAAAIHVTGNTVIDALHWASACVRNDPSLVSGLADIEQRFAGRRIVAVTSHRRENLGEGMEGIAQAIRMLAAQSDLAVIFPVHVNPQVRSVMNENLAGLENVALIDPLDYPHFVRLLDICHLVLTDSGGVQEEAPALGKPVLVMRETTERPEGVAAGTAKLVGTDPDRIVAEASRLLYDEFAYARMAQAHNPYGDGKSAARITELLAQS